MIWHFFVFALFGVINGIKKYLCKGSAGSIALTFAEVLMFWGVQYRPSLSDYCLAIMIYYGLISEVEFLAAVEVDEACVVDIFVFGYH